MLRTRTCLYLLLMCALAVESQAPDDNNASGDPVYCDRVVGDGIGCYECYKERVKNRQLRKTLQLFNVECKSEELFCYSQKDSTMRNRDSGCGKSNPEGLPRRVRDSLRRVLPGQYPWRAWIFNKDAPETPVCAATLIDLPNHVLMTLAHCLAGLTADTLAVSFTKDADDSYSVANILIHKDYDANSRVNDVALLSLPFEKSMPSWVRPACLPAGSAAFGTDCISVSADDKYANVLITQRSNCHENASETKSSICSVDRYEDYKPEKGSALMCPEKGTNYIEHIVYGVSAGGGGHQLSSHTDVGYFKEWISNSINNVAP